MLRPPREIRVTGATMVPLVLLYIVVTAQTLRSGAAASADAFARGGVHGGGQEEEGQDDKIMQRPLEAQNFPRKHRPCRPCILLAHGLAESHDHDYNALSGCDISTAWLRNLQSCSISPSPTISQSRLLHYRVALLTAWLRASQSA